MKLQRIAMSGGSGPLPGETPNNDKVGPMGEPAPKAAPARTNPGAPTLQEVKKAVDNINDTIKSFVNHLEFFVDENNDRIVVRAVDTRTNEIIREFSTGKVVGIAKAVGKVRGLLLQENA